MSSGLDQLAALLPTIYSDLAQPSVKKVGKALSFATGLLTTPLEKREALRDKNLTLYFKKLEKEDEDNIEPAPPELAVPIIEKLRYVRSEELVDLYTELLLKASLKNSQDQAHPSYLEVIGSLSGDEAKFLQHLAKTKKFQLPYLEIRFTKTNEQGYNIVSRYFTCLQDDLNFNYPDNLVPYLDNMVRLGILEDMGTTHLQDEDAYNRLSNHESFLKIKTSWEQESVGIISYQKSALRVTEFGTNFMSVCIPK